MPQELLQKQQKELQALLLGFDYALPAAITAGGGASSAYGEHDEDDPYGEMAPVEAEPVDTGKPLDQHACFREGFGRADVQNALQGKAEVRRWPGERAGVLVFHQP